MPDDEQRVISLDDHRPHIVGPARCGVCGSEWVAVAPVKGEAERKLECPTCGFMEGVFR